MSKRIVVAGATGQQGGAVVHALLREGHHVVGITRNVDSTKAKSLISKGAEMVSVDMTHRDGLISVMQNVDIVFSMTTPFEGGLDVEIAQGKTMANAAKKAEVEHFIFNSVSDANRSTGIPHFDSKYEVEKHLLSLGLNYTIIGPTYFMDNLLQFNMEDLRTGVLRMAMPAGRKLQQVAVEDIGKCVAKVVGEGRKQYGKRLNIAGDEITGDEAATILSRILNKKIRYEGFSPDIIRSQSEDLAMMYEWFNNDGYTAEMEHLKAYNFLNFEQWANKQDWSSII